MVNFSDNEDRLWIGYYDKGLDKYDPRHFKFNFSKNIISRPNPFPKSISGIAKDKNGLIWFSSIDQGFMLIILATITIII